MSAPAIFSGTRTKLLTSKGLLLKSGKTIDNDGPKPWTTSTAYVQDDLLIFNNDLYVVVTGHTSSSANIGADIVSGLVEKIEDTANLLKCSANFSKAESANTWQTGSIAGYTAGTFPTASGYTVTFIGDVTTVYTINGNYALSVPVTTSSVGTLVGSPTMKITKAYSGKNLQLSFDYKIFSGSEFMNFSGTSANTMHVICYDVTNTKFIQPTNTYGITSLQGTWTGNIQPDNTCEQMKIILLRANNSTGAVIASYDNFYIGKEISPTGAVMTDPVQYTPIFGAGYGTVTNQKIYWQQNGKFMRVFGTATMGTSGVGTGEISLPSGRSIDSSYYQASAKNLVGGIRVIINTGGSGAGGTTQRLGFDGTTLDKVWLTSSSAQDAAGGTFVKTSVNSALSTSDTINIDFTVPILGWSSNVQLSSDAGNSNIVFYAEKTATQSGLVANTTKITYTSIIKDTSGSWNGTDTYTVQSPGDYTLKVGYKTATSSTTLGLFKNGSLYKTIGTPNNTYHLVFSRDLTDLKSGDLLDLRQASTENSVGDSTGLYYIQISKKANPQTIAASDTVAASYKSTAGGSIGTSFTLQSFTTKFQDTHGAWDGTTFRAPIPGLYRITSNVRTPSLTLGATQSFDNAVYKNGSIYMLLNSVLGNGGTNNWYMSGGSIEVPLLAGETLQIYAKANIATTQNTDPNSNFVSIVRVG